jgi:hypothetical protein
MLNDEQATTIVENCIRRVSHVPGIDFTGTMDDAGIVDATRVNIVVDLIVNDSDVGVRSQSHRIKGGLFNNVAPDTVVDDVVTIVMKASPIPL